MRKEEEERRRRAEEWTRRGCHPCQLVSVE
jgi:hypothetical protein